MSVIELDDTVASTARGKNQWRVLEEMCTHGGTYRQVLQTGGFFRYGGRVVQAYESRYGRNRVRMDNRSWNSLRRRLRGVGLMVVADREDGPDRLVFRLEDRR